METLITDNILTKYKHLHLYTAFIYNLFNQMCHILVTNSHNIFNSEVTDNFLAKRFEWIS